jgi:pyruvate dehydrogenase E2 component (dihydrolipoamide acetyltransferase)
MHEIKLPKLGQSVEDASIVEWLKKEGDPVSEGEPICTVQTDKAEIEVECTASGTLRKILVQPDIEVPVLSVIALVGDAKEALPDLAQYGDAATPTAPTTPPPATGNQKSATSETSPLATGNRQPATSTPSAASPRARRAAEEHGIALDAVAGTGAGGRILAEDVLAHAGSLADVRVTPVARQMAAQAGLDLRNIEGTGERGKITKADVQQAQESRATAPKVKAAPAVATGETKRVPLSPMRRVIAQRMAESKYSAPHYYVTVEVDMAAAKAYRSAQSFKASYNDLVLYACTRALRDYPQVNARWAGDAIELVGDVNLGMAVALPQGLIVPVVKQAQLLSLEGLAQATRALAEKAKNNKLTPDDYTGNTFTVSNLGVFGVDDFTAIINLPDSAILAIGQMKDRPVVIDGGIHIRPIMKMTISSDHRVIDGAVAAQFMGHLKVILETASF